MGEKEKNPKSAARKGIGKSAARTNRSATAADPAKLGKAAVLGEAPPRAAGVASARTIMSVSELAQLGGGVVAYIKVMTHDEAKAMFPGIEELPTGINLYALHAADGTPLALTDSRQAAVGQAMGSELAIASLH